MTADDWPAMDNLPNGTIGVDTRQVARMRRQLNDTQRQLLLSQQVVRQLEKIHETYEEFKDVTTQLVLNSDAIDAEEETKRIDELKIEIKKLEDRLKLIKRFDNGGPHIDVKPMPVKKIGTNKYRILDREVSINRRASAGDRSSSVELLSNDGESAEEVLSLSRSRQWSGTTVGTENTGLSGRTASIEEELRDINPRRNRSGRQTIIPQRFESFPSAVYRHRRLATGLIGLIVFAVLAIFSLSLYQVNDSLLADYLQTVASNAKRSVMSLADRVVVSVGDLLSAKD